MVIPAQLLFDIASSASGDIRCAAAEENRNTNNKPRTRQLDLYIMIGQPENNIEFKRVI